MSRMKVNPSYIQYISAGHQSKFLVLCVDII